MEGISVTIISDDDVRQIIVASRAGATKENFLHINKPRDTVQRLPLEIVEEEDEMSDEYNTKPTALLDDTPIQHFGFSTPKKKASMLENVISTRKLICPQSPSTPISSRVVNTTPRTRRSSRGSTPIPAHSPMSARKSRRSLTPIVSTKTSAAKQVDTPHRLRKIVKIEIKRLVEQTSEEEYDDSDLDKHYEPSDSDESDDEESEHIFDLNDNTTPQKLRSTPQRYLKHTLVTPPKIGTPRRRVRRSILTPNKPNADRADQVDVDMTDALDDYFMNANAASCVTSDHTLNRLEVPRLAPDTLHDLLRDSSSSHKIEKEEIFAELVDYFPKWITLLLEGFSIFLCGVGSKKKLLTQLQQEYLSCSDHLVINGFFPSLTLRNIMTSIFQEILCLSNYPQSQNEQLKYLRKHYNSNECNKLFLVINNLDGPIMKSSKMQHCISQLSAMRHVHLIASVDHINAPLLLDGSKLSLYNALWFDATTLLSYSEETSYENSLLVQQSGDLAFSSLIHVFQSLTPNAKGIFTLLAKHKLQSEDGCNYTGLSFGALYKMCRESFLVNSDLTLRAQLTEFKDHKLIQAKKSLDGVENIYVALNPTTLKDFLDMEDS